MTIEGIEIKKAENLPLEVRKDTGIYSGLVEIRYERNSPLSKKVEKIEGTFAEHLRSTAKEEGIIGNDQ